MAKQITNNMSLEDEQIDQLLTLLSLVEEADEHQKAVWLSKDERDEIAQIREDIAAQTGHN